MIRQFGTSRCAAQHLAALSENSPQSHDATAGPSAAASAAIRANERAGRSSGTDTRVPAMLPLAQSSPCGVKTRTEKPCHSAAIPNGRCRLHGGASTEPRTAEGLARIRKARTVHGHYSARYRQIAKLVKLIRAEIRMIFE